MWPLSGVRGRPARADGSGGPAPTAEEQTPRLLRSGRRPAAASSFPARPPAAPSPRGRRLSPDSCEGETPGPGPHRLLARPSCPGPAAPRRGRGDRPRAGGAGSQAGGGPSGPAAPHDRGTAGPRAFLTWQSCDHRKEGQSCGTLLSDF